MGSKGGALFRNTLIGVLFARLAVMALLPVTDTTESRYVEISRIMFETSNWLTPQLADGVPFWGKPPLFAWLSAGAMQLLGSAEILLRLPHFLVTLITLAIMASWIRDRVSPAGLWLTLLVLASTPVVWICMGTVMTESGVLLCTTLGMAGFWRGAVLGERGWGLTLFVGLGLGMLAKGPVVPMMILIPIFAWCLVGKEWAALRQLPWFGGIFLMLLLFVPWYMATEFNSPGFLEYFLLGEHILRFIQPGWSGDLYGNPHTEPYGMIWLFWFQAGGLWSLVLIWSFVRPQVGRAVKVDAQWQRYLLFWLLAPMLFFTFSGNILWTYVISGMPALALLIAGEFAPSEQRS